MKHTSNYLIKEVYFTSILFGQKKYIWRTFEKKTHGDIISLHKCTKNHDHMLYCSWDLAHDEYNFYFSFRAFLFCSFTPMTARKTNFFQKMQKSLEISLFYTCVPKRMIKWCTVPEIWFVTDRRKERWTDGQMDVKSDI